MLGFLLPSARNQKCLRHAPSNLLLYNFPEVPWSECWGPTVDTDGRWSYIWCRPCVPTGYSLNIPGNLFCVTKSRFKMVLFWFITYCPLMVIILFTACLQSTINHTFMCADQISQGASGAAYINFGQPTKVLHFHSHPENILSPEEYFLNTWSS